ncbi:MAG TPA: CehA/McbA family metallohydrolase [Bryobacteraceae bacterium]|nr:CehA/McbA family metallohydrolase [Bryobacteraceae bacterium]
MNRRRFIGDVARGAALGQAIHERAAAQSLNGGKALLCRVIDADSGQATPARIRLLDSHGEEVVPIGHPQTLPANAQEGDVRIQRRRFAYVNGSFEVDPRRLPLRYQVIKGYEYTIAEGTLTAGQARDGVAAIPLSRWSRLSGRNWYSGDIHIHHISPKTCRLEMEAEDLNVANILTSDFTEDQAEFEGRINANSGGDRLIYVNQEFRNHHLGHMCLLNLKKLIEPVKPAHPYQYPLHLDVCDRVHAQGGYVAWAHFPSWPGAESPLDVALEKLDGLEIMSVLEPREFPLYLKQVVTDAEPNSGLHLWYRFLNCGFRLTATAGTDKMTTWVTAGSNRVYAQLDGEFTYQNWIGALKAGNTFVSNSPLLRLTVNGKPPGATLNLTAKKAKAIEIRAAVDSQLPCHRLEIVANGQVIAQATPTGRRYHAEIQLEYPVHQSCWVAARAYEDIDPYRARGVDFTKIHNEDGTLHGSLYGTRRPETVFAHTSPIYVMRDGAPIRSWDDAQYYVRYLDRAIEWLRKDAKFAKRDDLEASVTAFRAGRAIYEKRAAEARAQRKEAPR